MFSTARARRRLALTLSLLFACLALRPCVADTSVAIQRAEAVSAVVLGILSYASWPQEPSILNLCVAGPVRYADALLRGGLRQPSGRLLSVQQRSFDDPWLGELCNVIYLGPLSDTARHQVFNTLAGHAVLSISEDNPGCSVGSMFCLDLSQAQVGFVANLDAVAASGVHMHPAVLKLGNRRVSP